MGVTIAQYPITPTVLGTGIDGKLRHCPNLGAYAEYASSGGTHGFRFWSDRTLTKKTEWTTTNPDMVLYGGASYENWCIGLETGKVFTVPTGFNNAIKRLTPITLATELTFGNTQDNNDSNSIRFSYGLSPALDLQGKGYVCSISLTNGCYIFDEGLVPIACSNANPSFTPASVTLDFFSYIPNPTTGRAQWWFGHGNNFDQYISANIISYVPGSITIFGAENATMTEVHRLYWADMDTFFGADVDVFASGRYIPCPEANTLLVCAQGVGGTGMYVVALNLSDTSEVLWTKNYPGCAQIGPNSHITSDYGNRPLTRGRYMALGDTPTNGYSPHTVYLIDLATGNTLDSGAITSIVSSTSEPERSFWNATTGKLICFTGGGSTEGIATVAFDYDLSAGLAYGQDFSFPIDSVNGYRGERLERSNVTGVINTLFEDLQDKLTGYVDADAESFLQQPLDMNNHKIVNLADAVDLDDVISKSQAEGLV